MCDEHVIEDLCPGCGRDVCICGNARAQIQAYTHPMWQWDIIDSDRRTAGRTSDRTFAERVVARRVKITNAHLVDATGTNGSTHCVYARPDGREFVAQIRRVQEIEL